MEKKDWWNQSIERQTECDTNHDTTFHVALFQNNIEVRDIILLHRKNNVPMDYWEWTTGDVATQQGPEC